MGKSIFSSEDAAEMFITKAAEEKRASEPKVEAKSVQKSKREPRNRHLQLLLSQSVYNKLYAAFEKSESRSLNDFVNTYIEKNF